MNTELKLLEILFIMASFLVFYPYFGYPLSLMILGLFRNKPVRKKPFFPHATLIITAYNEESQIGQKLHNTIMLEYPREKLQVLVASDGSTDRTEEIVREYAEYGIELLSIGERRGKENAQKKAVQRADGDILIFTDVATKLDPKGIQEIVGNFADSSVGCVSSEDRVTGKDGKPSGEGAYVRYEMWLRRLESRTGSVVGLSGSFFAARKQVCADFSEEMQSDFRTVLNSMKMGLRGVSDPRAVGYYQDISDGRRELDRKIRTVLRGVTVFFQHLEFLNVLRYGWFSYQYFCHKLLRWSVPFFLGAAFVSNAILARQSVIYLFLFICQSIFYTVAIWGCKKDTSKVGFAVRIPTYFLTVNVSILAAWWRYLKGQRVTMWNPSQRR